MKYLFKAVDTATEISQLNALDPFDGAVELLGLNAPGDGYGGVFRASTSALVPDGINTFAAQNGYYQRVQNTQIPNGLKYDGVTDDAPALQAIFSAIVISGKRTKVFLPHGTVKLNGPVILNSRYISLEAYCTFDATGIASGPALIIQNDGYGASEFGKKLPIYGAPILIGPGKATTTVGIKYDSDVIGSSSNARLTGAFIKGFGTGVSIEDNAYGITLFDCFIHGCGIGLDMDTGHSDYGERISAIGCTIAGCDIGVRNNNSNGALHITNTSIDYNSKHISANGGRIFLSNCHIEGRDYTAEPIEVNGNGGTISMVQGWINTTSPVSVPLIKCDTTSRQGGGVYLNAVFINNAGTSDFLASGNGEVKVENVRSYDIRNNPKAVSSTRNLLVADNASGYAFITSDTSNITSRLSGSNITLLSSADAVKSGGTSLKATKTFGSGSAASFNIAVPLNGRRVGWAKLFHKITGAQTGSFSISFGYADILDSPSTPAVRKIQLDSTSTVSVSAPYDWAECRGGEPINSAPAWATHFVINVNLFSIGAGSIYFDGIEVYEGY